MSSGDPARDEQAAIRVGDVERNAAVTALGEHMSTGRLDLDEYGTRSAQATAARTVGDLQALFADLPAPHPPLPGDGLTSVRRANSVVTGTAGSLPAVIDQRSRAQKFVGAAAAASGIIALVLFFTVGGWWWFLLIPLISTIASSIWGDSWRRPD
jgi:hypothetical protein